MTRTKRAEHTQSEWKLGEWDRLAWLVYTVTDDGDFTVCVIDRDEGEEWEAEMLANARLIAAAPKLLEACEAALKYTQALSGFMGKEGATEKIVKAAIAAATGADSWQELEQQAQDDIEAGRVTRHKDVDDAVEHLEGLDK